MRRMCRRRQGLSWRRRQRASEELLRQVRIVTDPAKLAYLHAEARKLRGNAEPKEENGSRP
jgi:hypothetical protein